MVQPSTKLSAIVLAAGKGTRMKSPLPKVMHLAAGKPLLGWVIDSLNAAAIDQVIVVTGPQQPEIHTFLKDKRGIVVCEQQIARGTGDAAASAAPAFRGVMQPAYAQCALTSGNPINSDFVIIANGDGPGLTPETLRTFLSTAVADAWDIAIIGFDLPDPTGYGRVERDSHGKVAGIVEEKDANSEQKKNTLCNTGVYCVRTKVLFELLSAIEPNNKQNEYYLTDCLKLAYKKGLKTGVFVAKNFEEFHGVNDQDQLRIVSELLLKRRKG